MERAHVTGWPHWCWPENSRLADWGCLREAETAIGHSLNPGLVPWAQDNWWLSGPVVFPLTIITAVTANCVCRELCWWLFLSFISQYFSLKSGVLYQMIMTVKLEHLVLLLSTWRTPWRLEMRIDHAVSAPGCVHSLQVSLMASWRALMVLLLRFGRSPHFALAPAPSFSLLFPLPFFSCKFFLLFGICGFSEDAFWPNGVFKLELIF